MNGNRSPWALPVAIIIVILLIAGAFYFGGKNPSTNNPNPELSKVLPIASGINLEKFRPVDATDKIRGSIDAPIKLVVYTDLECPACKYFHIELKKMEENYTDTDKIAIIYRDFPLDSLHAKSRAEHLAAACVNELGGNDKFLQFFDKIFEITPSNDGLELAKLGETAKTLGIDSKAFEDCMTAKKYADAIQKSVDEAMALGAPGTPFFILVTADQTIPVFGGLPAEQLTKAFDLLLGVLVVNGTSTPATDLIDLTASTTTE